MTVRRLFALVVGRGAGESAELREARLRTLPDTWLLMVATIFWSQAGGWYVLALTGRRWAVLWIVADAALEAARVVLKTRHHRGHAQQTPQLYQAMATVNIVWFLVTAVAITALLRLGDPGMLVLGTMLAVGWMGVVASRYAAFPRLGAGLLYLLGAAATAGFLFSPDLGVMAILTPGAPVAYQLLLRQNYMILMEAITAREENLHLSMHDPLTGLPNRLLLRERLAALLKDQHGRTGGVAVLCLDLDGFKPVNDRYGHAGGDWLLRSVAARLRTAVREIDLVCRTGGDEFVVLLPEAGRADAVHIAERLIASCREPHDVGGTAMVRVGLSVGIALAPEHGRDIDELLSFADDALYSSKRGSKGVWTLHSSDA
ncbi:GGDEF domain-containing protein [Actinoplanes sp. TBRC 11911]|uniref:GGDEF domain-containing protein n=1 Tax=Actinoplanes sp. TBRC 11911 TaxID=2729386 RepID=UPI00145E125F|nr:GGDEF domain-containing protein [Actinoplanes sp. TBRC 11911]NMO55230.1 GGDEF domain-containing protein [Actinoplanes sp. TBRC 11911]